jgi:D-beta-D-heptose 7-phosphate kinase/D-beta-D-heptose 1-phosphate adenosyltransferase
MLTFAPTTYWSMREIQEFLDKVAGFHVLVIGDLMLDRYLYGAVERISPEAPVPILSLHSSTSMPGGAANVIMNLAGLGCRTTVIGCVGNDGRGEQLLSMLEERDIDTQRITSVKGWPTTTKTRVIGGHQHMLRRPSKPALLPV